VPKSRFWDLGKSLAPPHVISRYNLSMNRSAAEVLEDVRRLPPGELDWLIGELLQSGDGSSAAEIDASWKTEVERRVAEAEAGTAVTYSWEEVEAPLRARLAR
jgi:putative addiction module component (TIGR02574 family)